MRKSYNQFNNLMRKGLQVLLIAIALMSCDSKVRTPDKPEYNNQKNLQEALIKANQVAIAEERQMIARYAERRGWDLREARGIYYQRYHDGHGKKVVEGSYVVYDYTLSLINGVIITKSDTPEQMTVSAKGSEVSGLHRAMGLFSQGDKAKVIVPSHLAYGLAGNQKDIPQKSTLIYDIHLLRVE